MWKALLGGLTLGVLAVVLVVVMILVATIGGVWWFVSDDSPLLYYDARPAMVDEPGLTQTRYEVINDTAFNLSYSPIPFVGRDVRIRSWATVYATGVTLPNGSETTVAADGSRTGANVSVDPANASLVTVFSMSALQLGPVAFNPIVYASDPRLLNESGVLVDKAETWLPTNVTNVTNVDVRSSRDVRMLGQATQMTTLTGELVLEEETDERIDVRLYLARVVHDGELVVVLGIAPLSGENEVEFATLVEHVSMGEWGATPGWVPPTPPDPTEFPRTPSVDGLGSVAVAARAF